MCKSKLIAITNRKLYSGEDYPSKLIRVIKEHPHAMILREKEMTEEEYRALARILLPVCESEGVILFIHSHADLARELGCRNIHLSIPGICRMAGIDSDTVDSGANAFAPGDYVKDFDQISVSCHSAEDVRIAESLGATQIVLGTIFETDCKKGLKGRGVDFVCEITGMTKLPVYAIGGIKTTNLEQVLKAGAAGGCMMSGFLEND